MAKVRDDIMKWSSQVKKTFNHSSLLYATKAMELSGAPIVQQADTGELLLTMWDHAIIL